VVPIFQYSAFLHTIVCIPNTGVYNMYIARSAYLSCDSRPNKVFTKLVS